MTIDTAKPISVSFPSFAFCADDLITLDDLWRRVVSTSFARSHTMTNVQIMGATGIDRNQVTKLESMSMDNTSPGFVVCADDQSPNDNHKRPVVSTSSARSHIACGSHTMAVTGRIEAR